MVILAHIRWNSFSSITESRIVFEFLTAHSSLDFCTFMCRFGCYYFCNSLKNLRLALILIRTAYTLLMQKGNGTLTALFHIRTAFRCMTGWTSEDFCSLFVEFKISKDIRSWFPCQACGNQFYVFISCKLCVFCSAVCSICDYNSPFFLFTHLLKVFLDKLTVTVVVLLILILCYNRTIGSNGFLKIGYISPMLFPALLRNVASGSEGFCIMDDFMPPSSFVRSLRFSFLTMVCSERHLTNKSYSVESL